MFYHLVFRTLNLEPRFHAGNRRFARGSSQGMAAILNLFLKLLIGRFANVRDEHNALESARLYNKCIHSR